MSAKLEYKSDMLENCFSSYSSRAGGKQGSVTRCRKCQGSGIEVKLRQIGPGMMQQMQSTCSDCTGSGDFIREKDKCKKCKGKRVLEVENKLEVCCGRGGG